MEFDANNYTKENLLPLMEDEELRDGYPYCKKCGTPRYMVIDFDGKERYVRGHCDCEKKRIEEEQKREKALQNELDFKNKQKLSMIGDKYLNAKFKTATITQSNKPIYLSAWKYIENADKMIERAIGLYIHGDNSSGKTYLIACMCNELVKRGYSCVFTSIPKLLAEMQRKVRQTAISRAEIVDEIASKKFLFIDDLGKEFLGSKTEWEWGNAEKLLLDVLNARYSNGLPTIFTSNYSLGEFATKFNLDKAILERVNEMATRSLKLDGDNFRNMALVEKSEFAKSLGI